jgi:hypothetical protein
MAKQDGGGGMLAQARRDLSEAKSQRGGREGREGRDGRAGKAAPQRPSGTKRTTPPKNRPTPTGKASKTAASRPGGNRPKNRKKR